MMKYSAAIFLATFLLTVGWKHANATDVSQADTVTVEVKGTNVDARFDPAVVTVNPGDVIQFVVREGLHTVTAYHPENRRPQRIPALAKSFDSGLMEQGDQWVLTISVEGVYDYFCLPHERMGHAGRIIVGSIETMPDYPTTRIPQAVLEKINTETNNFLTKQYH